MKINQSRKSTHSIMAHSGFGVLTITREGTSILVPKSWLFNDGRIKKFAVKNIDMMFKNAKAAKEMEAKQIETAI